jgi:hypothetical protein
VTDSEEVIEARWAAAAPGPWTYDVATLQASVLSTPSTVHRVRSNDENVALTGYEADAVAISHAPSDVATLLARLRAERKQKPVVAEAAEHLTPQVTDRGFTHLPPIPVWSGYNMVGDFEDLTPHEVGTVRVYESSDAVVPSIWLSVRIEEGVRLGTRLDDSHMLTIDNAHKLGEQLILLADNHYSGSGASDDDGAS